MELALRGLIPGVSRIVLTGANNDVDVATTPEDVWGGDGLIPRPSSDESWEIVGGGDDTAAGTGARTVSLTTMSGAYVHQTQTITMNGAVAVPLTGVHRFINIGAVLTAGSLGGPSQPLVIRVAGGGAVRAYISTEGLLNQAKFTVPDGFTLALHSASIGIRTNTGAEGSTFTLAITNEAGRVLQTLRLPTFSAGVSYIRHEVAGALLPFTRISARNECSLRGLVTTANNTQLDAAILALLYDNALWP